MATAPQVRTGRVSSIDYKHGTYEVVFADRGSVSCTINAQSNGEYKMPEIGQTVSVTMNGNGTWARSGMQATSLPRGTRDCTARNMAG